MIICLPLAFLGVGAPELILVLVVALLLFGPRELPRIARTIGKFMAQIRSVSDEFQSQVMRIGDEVVTSAKVDDSIPAGSPGSDANALTAGSPQDIPAGTAPVSTPEMDQGVAQPSETVPVSGLEPGAPGPSGAGPVNEEIHPVEPAIGDQNKDTSNERSG